MLFIHNCAVANSVYFETIKSIKFSFNLVL